MHMAERPTAGDYLRVLRTTVPEMIGRLKELALAELRPSLKNGGLGAGLFGAAAFIAFTALKLLVLAAAFAFAVCYAEIAHRHPLTALALGFLTIAVVFLVLALVLALFGRGRIVRVRLPEATIAETMTSLSAVADAIETGTADAQQQRIPDDALAITREHGKLPAETSWDGPRAP